MDKKSPNGLLGLMKFYNKILIHWLAEILDCNFAFSNFSQLAVIVASDSIQNQFDGVCCELVSVNNFFRQFETEDTLALSAWVF